MDAMLFTQLVNRLEMLAQRNPARYRWQVAMVALLGFFVLALAVLFALIPLAVLVLLGILVVATGGKALILLLKLGKLLLLLVWPAWMMLKTSFSMLTTRFPPPQGRMLSVDDAPVLFARIAELRSRMRGPAIHRVMLTNEMNAAILQHPRFGLFGWEQNYLILGLPLLQVMSEEEALAVIAHEYGHLSGHHSRFGGFIYRLRSAWGRLQTLSEQWQDWGSRLIARLFRWYAPYFNAYTFVFARQNEYQADQSSVELVGAEPAAKALMRVNIASQFEHEIFWPEVERQVLTEPEPTAKRSHFWMHLMQERLDAETRTRFFENAMKQHTDHLDTHPALADRLAAIGYAVNEEHVESMAVPLQTAAMAWLQISLLDEFDTQWRDSVRPQWQERHQYFQTKREKLQDLQSLDNPDADQRWEMIVAQEELKLVDNTGAMVHALLAEHPEYLPARFRRGVVLLQAGDEQGIADLEFVMERDVATTSIACEAAWRYYRDIDHEKAAHYQERWQAREDYLQRVNQELSHLPSNAALEVHQVADADIDQIKLILQRNRQHIRRVYLLRRRLVADPELFDHVLAFETSWWTLGDKGPKVLKALTGESYPFSMFIINLKADSCKPFRKKIRKLKVQPIFIA